MWIDDIDYLCFTLLINDLHYCHLLNKITIENQYEIAIIIIIIIMIPIIIIIIIHS